jgi:hypothetical protein
MRINIGFGRGVLIRCRISDVDDFVAGRIDLSIDHQFRTGVGRADTNIAGRTSDGQALCGTGIIIKCQPVGSTART